MIVVAGNNRSGPDAIRATNSVDNFRYHLSYNALFVLFALYVETKKTKEKIKKKEKYPREVLIVDVQMELKRYVENRPIDNTPFVYYVKLTSLR